MVKLSTTVEAARLEVGISLHDRVVVLGSCFADSMGSRMKDAGFDVLVNPFGTLYNPASIADAIARLDSGTPFDHEDCIEMGAGASLICSFHHHTSFARPTEEEFLANANAELKKASDFWKSADKVIITYGTSFIWEHDGKAVSNCLKRPAKEFTRRMLPVGQTSSITKSILDNHSDKQFIFTVSPIRHLNPDGAHANTLSKAALQLALDDAIKQGACYFPAYEIVLDELRDYRFYAEDLVHPSKTAEDIVWERFQEAACLPEEAGTIRENERHSRCSRHIENGRQWKKA